MKDAVQWHPLSPQAGLEPGTARSAGQRLTN